MSGDTDTLMRKQEWEADEMCNLRSDVVQLGEEGL